MSPMELSVSGFLPKEWLCLAFTRGVKCAQKLPLCESPLHMDGEALWQPAQYPAKTVDRPCSAALCWEGCTTLAEEILTGTSGLYDDRATVLKQECVWARLTVWDAKCARST